MYVLGAVKVCGVFCYKYDIIKAIHFAFGHGSPDRSVKETRRKCANITISATHLLLSVPEVRSSNKERKNEGQLLGSVCVLSSKNIFRKI